MKNIKTYQQFESLLALSGGLSDMEKLYKDYTDGKLELTHIVNKLSQDYKKFQNTIVPELGHFIIDNLNILTDYQLDILKNGSDFEKREILLKAGKIMRIFYPINNNDFSKSYNYLNTTFNKIKYI